MKKLRELAAKDAVILTGKQMKDVKGGVEKFQQFLDGGLVVEGGNDDGDGPKVRACYGKEYAAPCSWEYNGKTYYGKCCGSFMGSKIHCTDLNCYK